MDLIGAVVAFLLGSRTGQLVALDLQGARTNHLDEHAADQRAPAPALAKPTPPSGWTIEQVRVHTETADEERPR